MKISKFFPPYYKSNNLDKCTLKTDYQKKAGVYFIKDNTNTIIYIGHSSTNLYKTIYRHFQEWNDRRQFRHIYDKYGYTVRVITTTPTQAPRVEAYLIQKMQPRDNEIKYENATYFKDIKLKDIEPLSKDEIIDDNAPY
jgi:excinuclease UvrABC nuclease subunit